ncbi:MAG: PH domain-containing protein [Sarcina sp.]
MIILIVIPSLPYGFVGSGILFAGILAFCIARWMNEFIIIDEDDMFYKRGILVTEQIKIPITSISLIEFNRNIIHRIFGLSEIKIESISPKDRKFEIIMILKKEKIKEFEKFMSLVDGVNDGNFELDNKKSYKISAKHLLILSTLRSNIFLGIGIIYSIVHFMNDLDNHLGESLRGYIINNIKYGFNETQKSLSILVYVLILLVVSVSVILGFSVLGIISKYYKFKLDRKQNHLYVNHGLLVRRHYSIKIDNIHAIKVEQNFVNQILNLYTIKASVVGYGNEMQEDEVIFPLCTEAGFRSIIKKMIPEFSFEGEIHRPPKKSFNNFFMSWTSYSVIFAVLVYYYFNGSIIGAFTIPIMILWRYLIKENSSLGVKDNILFFSSGSFLRRITLVRSTSMVECFRVVNLFQRRKNICDYRIRFYNQRKLEWIRIKNMDNYLYEDIKVKMRNTNV